MAAESASSRDGLPIDITALTHSEAHGHCRNLADILIACVNGGASVSFMAPLAWNSAIAFWRDVAEGVERGERLLIVARERYDNRIIGTVQVVLKQPENQSHRADLAKMLVSPDARRRGVAARLMQRVRSERLCSF